MNLNIQFSESKQSFDVGFGDVINLSEAERQIAYQEGHSDATEEMQMTIDSIVTNDTGTAKTVESNAITLRRYAFAHSDFVTIRLPNTTRVENYGFASCAFLKNVYMPKVAILTQYSFQNCSDLETVDLPSLTSMSTGVFINCTKLVTLILRNNQVCVLNNSSQFAGTPIVDGTGFIYVPDNLLEQYKSDEKWSVYASQIKPISELE